MNSPTVSVNHLGWECRLAAEMGKTQSWKKRETLQKKDEPILETCKCDIIKLLTVFA